MNEEARAAFTSLSTATVTMALLKKGLRNVWLRGVRALDPSAPRVVGKAFTMRFVPFAPFVALKLIAGRRKLCRLFVCRACFSGFAKALCSGFAGQLCKVFFAILSPTLG